MALGMLIGAAIAADGGDIQALFLPGLLADLGAIAALSLMVAHAREPAEASGTGEMVEGAGINSEETEAPVGAQLPA